MKNLGKGLTISSDRPPLWTFERNIIRGIYLEFVCPLWETTLPWVPNGVGALIE